MPKSTDHSKSSARQEASGIENRMMKNTGSNETKSATLLEVTLSEVKTVRDLFRIASRLGITARELASELQLFQPGQKA
ncbi:hypothetical protein D3C74_411800 [compost metagenome]